MRLFNRSSIFGLILLFALTACGGGGGSDDAAEANTNCVVGSSKIGDCKI